MGVLVSYSFVMSVQIFVILRCVNFYDETGVYVQHIHVEETSRFAYVNSLGADRIPTVPFLATHVVSLVDINIIVNTSALKDCSGNMLSTLYIICSRTLVNCLQLLL